MHLYEIIDVKHVIVILKQPSKNIEPKKGNFVSKVILVLCSKKWDDHGKGCENLQFIVNMAMVNFHMPSPGWAWGRGCQKGHSDILNSKGWNFST